MTQLTNNLSKVLEGSEVIIGDVISPGPFRRHLLELGFVKGTPVRCLSINTLLGSIDVRVRGAKISLRIFEAALIKLL
jgi:ferrous iron transport protein A